MTRKMAIFNDRVIVPSWNKKTTWASVEVAELWKAQLAIVVVVVCELKDGEIPSFLMDKDISELYYYRDFS